VWTPSLLRPMAPAIELPTVPTPSQVRRTLGDPRVLTVLVVVALIFVMGFRQSIAREIGTAGSAPSVLAPAAVHSAQVVSPTLMPHQGADYVPVVKLHAPRDPFLPSPGATGTSQSTAMSHATAVTVGTTTTPAGSYRVRVGDSLWAIARRGLSAAPNSAKVSSAWRSLYAANRPSIGSNPSHLRVGLVLRLPNK
jgi:nucleoid-associated protein YgaU